MRNSILAPIPELDLAATLLDAAATAILMERHQLAGQLVGQADLPEIMAYARRAVGPSTLEVHRKVGRPACLPFAQRDPARMPGERTQGEIFNRDGWRCRFCGIRVICKSARAAIIRAFPVESHWVRAEYERHAALYAIASSLDHVLPHGRGGMNEEENFVTACYCCQFGRGEWTLDESELHDPTKRAPVVDGWDGLSRLVTCERAALIRNVHHADARNLREHDAS